MVENLPGNVGVKGQGGHALDPLLNRQQPHYFYIARQLQPLQNQHNTSPVFSARVHIFECCAEHA